MTNYLIVIHTEAHKPIRFEHPAIDGNHARIIGLHSGLWCGKVTEVEVEPLRMKTKNHRGQLLLPL